ncbi:hypothetical protein [Salipiger sp. IMCC34102]|nr:hypothetical protein [Salipiger sp. IMCC34102]
MKKIVLTLAALSALAACSSQPEPMAPMATQQPTMVMAEPSMNKL